MRIGKIRPVDTLTMLAMIADEIAVMLGGKASLAWAVDAIREKEETQKGDIMAFETPEDFKQAWQSTVERMHGDG